MALAGAASIAIDVSMTPAEQALVSCVRQTLKRIYEPRLESLKIDGSRPRLSLFDLLERCDANIASKQSANGMTIAAHVHHLSTGLYDVNELLMGEPDTLHDQTNWCKSVNNEQWRALVSELKRRYYEVQGWLSFEFDLPYGSSETYLFELGFTLVEHASYHLGALEQWLGV